MNDPNSSGQFSSCMCLFFVSFGRQRNFGNKRSGKSNLKYFKTFRTDGHQHRLSTAQAEKGTEHQKLEMKEEKEEIFKRIRSAFVTSLDAHLKRS